jgi:hypothetical protein
VRWRSFVGAVNVKDFFRFEKGLTLSIPESKKPDIFRRTRAILAADNLPAMLAATVVLAIAANFYELLCTAGFPMVYTRLLTLADLSPAGRYAYLAAYNLIYVAAAGRHRRRVRRHPRREEALRARGAPAQAAVGPDDAGLGALLLLAPERVSQVGIAFGLMAVAVLVTWIAAPSLPTTSRCPRLVLVHRQLRALHPRRDAVQSSRQGPHRGAFGRQQARRHGQSGRAGNAGEAWRALRRRAQQILGRIRRTGRARVRLHLHRLRQRRTGDLPGLARPSGHRALGHIPIPAHVEPLSTRRAAFEDAYQSLKKRIEAFLALPLETMSREESALAARRIHEEA